MRLVWTLGFASLGAIMWATTASAQEASPSAAETSSTQPSTSDDQSNDPSTAQTVTSTAAQPYSGSTAPAKQPPSGTNPSAVGNAAPVANGDIVVTGIRASLATALQAKKVAPQIEEVLSAEDIGKLPDNNIAESLARLPGISTNRDRGNPTTISIRGFPAELTDTLLNGREMVSGDPTRNVRFDQYPAELITGAAVYKSPMASQIAGAIAGQVDLQTARPLDYKAPQVVVDARAEYNDLSHDVRDAHSIGWIASGSYIGQFANDTLGIALGVAARNEPVATERTNIYRYTNSYADLNGDGVSNDDIPYGFEALQRGGSDKRVGALGTVQWRPGNGLEVTSDFFFSRVKYSETQRGFSVQDLPFGNSFSNITIEDGGATSGTATNYADYGIELENNNQLYTFTDTLFAGGLNAKYDVDRWHLDADFGASTVTRHAMFLNEYSQAINPDGSTNVDGVTVNWASNAGDPSQFSFNQSLTDPTLNAVTNLEIPSNGNGAPIIHDTLYAGKANVAYDLTGSWFSSLSAGLRISAREKDLTQRTQYGSIDAADRGPLPASLQLSPLTWTDGFSSLPSSMTWDVVGVADQLFGGIDPTESVDDERSSWEVDERTYAGYVQTNFDHDLGSMKLTGNLGLRVVRTNDTSKGTQINQASATGIEVPSPVVYHNDYTDWLPALNATLHIDDHQQIRFAASRAMARPPLDDLNAGYAVYGTASPPAAYGGNPELEPYRANQLDLTYEHYFSRNTAATISFFYKKLDSFIVQQISTFTTTVNGYEQDGTFQQPVNVHGGTAKGFEILYQQAFTFLPNPFDGFGVYANYSYTDSGVNITEGDNSIGTTAIPGFSKNVYNLSLYYSKHGIDADIAYRYRSHFVTETGDTDRLLVNGSEGVLSAQVSYTFPDSSALRGLKLEVQGDNLNNAPYILYYGDKAQQGRYELFGRQFYAGVSYRF